MTTESHCYPMQVLKGRGERILDLFQSSPAPLSPSSSLRDWRPPLTRIGGSGELAGHQRGQSSQWMQEEQELGVRLHFRPFAQVFSAQTKASLITQLHKHHIVGFCDLGYFCWSSLYK